MKKKHVFDQYKTGHNKSEKNTLKDKIRQEIHDMKKKRGNFNRGITRDIEYLQKTYNLFDNPNKWKRAKKWAIVGAALFSIGLTSYYMNNYQKAKEYSKRTTIEYSDPQKTERKGIIDYNGMATQKEKKLNQKEDLEHKLNSAHNLNVGKNEQPIIPAKTTQVNSYIPNINKSIVQRISIGKGFKYLPVRGDTLWQIAKDIYSSGKEYVKIKRANNLTTDLIEVNQILNIPYGVKNKAHLFFENIDCFKYTAKKDDTLSSISSKIYGSVNYAKKILEFNKQINPRFSEKIWNKELVYLPLKMEK